MWISSIRSQQFSDRDCFGVYSCAPVSLEAANLRAIKRADLGHNDSLSSCRLYPLTSARYERPSFVPPITEDWPRPLRDSTLFTPPVAALTFTSLAAREEVTTRRLFKTFSSGCWSSVQRSCNVVSQVHCVYVCSAHHWVKLVIPNDLSEVTCSHILFIYWTFQFFWKSNRLL